MFTWPTDAVLPFPDINFAGSLDDNALRISMDDGQTRQRRKFTEARMVYNVQWTFSNFQLALFRSILKHKLNDGTEAFNMLMRIGGYFSTRQMRIIDGHFSSVWQDTSFWVVQCQMEEIYVAGFCTPNVAAFLTNPLGEVDLSMYFGVQLASPFAATNWRLHTDDCGFNILYYTGTVNDDGTLNPGPSTGEVGNGFNSDRLVFVSGYPYHEGMYLQVNCGGLWSNMPCIEGGNGSPSDPTGE